jgi:peptidoglycan-N-acetylglucosamine deacetylase
VPILTGLLASGLSMAGSQGIILNGSRDKPRIALTFDADMTPYMKRRLELKIVPSYNNTAIIDELIETNTKATFFLSGMWIEIYKDATRAMAKNPLFELENHSYSHPAFALPCFGLGGVDPKDKRAQIEKTKNLLKTVAGVQNRYFRFPGGCATDDDVKLVHSLGLEVVHWDVIGLDGDQPDADVIVRNVLSGARNGSIIVLHSHGGPKVPATQDALPKIIETLKARGFEFVTLSELLP